MIELTDQLGRSVKLAQSAQRIISLVPSQTELLHYLGLNEEVVGITKFCVHPDKWYRGKTRVGGTKTLNLEKIDELKPDLIIANKEENTKDEINLLSQKYPVYISDIYNTAESMQMIQDVGTLCGKEEEATDLVSGIKNVASKLPEFKGKVLYFCWGSPTMIVGPNTFIGHIIELIGFENAIEDRTVRYEEIDIDEIKELNPDYLLLSSEPFPFEEDHKIQMQDLTGVKSVLVDGEMFSWYGSRMLLLEEYMKGLHREIVG